MKSILGFAELNVYANTHSAPTSKVILVGFGNTDSRRLEVSPSALCHIN